MRSKRPRAGTAFAAFLLPVCAAGVAAGQIVTDGTVGAAETLEGDFVEVPADLGTQRGGNLFHSFSRFNVATGQTVEFTGPEEVRNVLARVTGGSPSSINGTLTCLIPDVNFYLINPSGVVFGPDAFLDVSGSFVVTTAGFVRLADGGRFDAANPAADVLTTAAPAAFGFLPASGTAASPAAGIEVPGEFRDVPVLDDDGAPVLDEEGNEVTETLPFPFLTVPDGKNLSLVGGPVRIVAGELRAPAGRLSVVAAGAGAEVALDPDDASIPGGIAAGGAREAVTIDGGALVAADAFADGLLTGGAVGIAGGDVRVDGASTVSTFNRDPEFAGGGIAVDAATLVVTGGSVLVAGVLDAGAGGDVSVTAATSVTLDLGGQISSDTTGPGAGGAVRVTTPLLLIDGGGSAAPAAGIFAETGLREAERAGAGVDPTFDTGPGGAITLDVGRLDVLNAGAVSATTVNTGPGGTLTVQAGDVFIDGAGFDGFTGLAAQTQGPGPGGSLQLTASGSLSVLGGGEVSTTAFRDGAGGSLAVQAGTLTIDGNGVARFTGLNAETQGAGAGGNLTVDVAGDARLLRGGGISGNAVGSGPGGAVSVTAASLTLDGRGAAVAPGTGVPVATGINATSGRTGPDQPPQPSGGAGGSITLDVPGAFTIVDATVRTNTNTAAPAGNLAVTAGTLAVELTSAGAASGLQSGIGANVEPGATGGGGNFTLRAESLSVSGGGRISVATFGPGNAGDLDVSAGSIMLANGGLIESSSEFLDASPFRGDTLGEGGDLAVQSDGDILVQNDALISARAQENNAGSIRVALPGTLTLDGGSITTEAALAGGNIDVGRTRAAPLNPTRPGGGKATASPRFVILRDGRITANAVERAGGNVTVRTDNLVADADSAITATSQLSTAGDIAIEGQIVDLAGTLARLPSGLADARAALQEACAAVMGSAAPSTFVSTGRGGSPAAPAGWAPSLDVGERRLSR